MPTEEQKNRLGQGIASLAAGAREDANRINDAYQQGGVGAAVGMGARVVGSRMASQAAKSASAPFRDATRVGQEATQAFRTAVTGDATRNAMQTAAKPADAADLDTGREHGPEPPPAVMEPLEKRIGGLTAKVSARPDGTHYDFGEFGTATVHPRNGAAGRPQAGLGYDPETARAVLARRMYGNINHLNQDGSQVAISPVAGQRATNNPGYTFVGGNADAQRFFQPVGRPGGYNPYKVRFRTLFDEQLDARFAKRQEEPRPQMDMSLPGHSRRLKYSEDMRAWEAQRARNQGYDPKMAELALKQEEMAQKAEALRQAGIGAGLQWQGQAMDNAAKEQALNRTARIQRLQARWIQSNDPTERAELAQQIQMLGGYGVNRENPDYRTLKDEMGNERLVRVDGDTYTPLTQAGQGRGLGEGNFKTPQIIAVYNAMPDEMKKRFDSAENDEAMGKILDEGFAWIKAQGKKK